MQQGLLLINLGTPDAPTVRAVRRYLLQFLSDPRVIALPVPIRYVLLYAFILPFRPKASAHAYQSIWTEQGSPLLVNSLNLTAKIQSLAGDQLQVALGMRYGKPSISEALSQLKACTHLTILPLYPQYSSSATGSTIEEVIQLLARQEIIPNLSIIRDFYQHPAYIQAQAAIIKPYLQEQDYLLFSFHGVPEKHLESSDCHQVCQDSCPSNKGEQKGCYRAQCYATSRKLAIELGINDQQYGVSFQSRLGKTPWIKPYTDQVLPELASKGIKRLAVACPSFVADCLETLEEISIRAREQWLKLGGGKFTLIPCLNDNDLWSKGVLEICGLNTRVR